MDIKKTLKAFADELGIAEYDEDKALVELTNLYPEIVLIVKKDEEFFTKDHTLFGEAISELNHEVVWKHLPMCLFCSFTTGDIKEKLGSVISIAKNYLSANPNESTEEFSRILSDEKSQSSIQDFIEYCTNTRVAKVLNDILENLDVTEFEHLLENPQQFIEIARNPEHPMVQKFIHKFQSLLKQKVERGEISMNKVQEDIEGIKAKLTSLFGRSITEALGGRGADVPSSVLTANTPEARRQRMIARLQRKQREKTQH